MKLSNDEIINGVLDSLRGSPINSEALQRAKRLAWEMFSERENLNRQEFHKLVSEKIIHDFKAMDRPSSDFDHRWHVAINQFNDGERNEGRDFVYWLYESKRLAEEAPRLKLLFEAERTGKLPNIHKQCSHSKPEPVPENHLTCCLGKKTRECEFLMALDKAEMSDEDRDTAKAWTCCGHVVATQGLGFGVDTSTGYLLTVDDEMFWDNVHESMARGYEMLNEEKGE